MAVRLITGSAFTLRERLKSDMRGALCDERGEPIVLVVPGQITLEAEQLALDAVGRPGSFRLQVLNPQRLCDKILEQAGGGLGARIDENGRAMLMRRALDSLDKPLCAYERARKSPGFAALASQAVAQWKEAGMTAEMIAQIAAARENTPLGDKLRDISTLFTAWHEISEGLGLDSEDARRIAMSRLQHAPFFHGARVWFYGFDLLSIPIAQSVIALSAVCPEISVLVPLNETTRDERLFSPIRRTYERLVSMLRAENVEFSFEKSEPAPRPENAVRVLERELYCYPTAPQNHIPREIRLYSAKNPRDEAEHIAAAIRQMVRRYSLRYSDIAVACQSESALYQALRRAFALYNIPVFFPESRKAAAHPLAATLLAALHIAAGPVYEQDAQTLLSLGYSAISDDEADRARIFAYSHGVTGRKWLREYLPGEDPDGKNAEFEELRARAFAPVEKLASGLKNGSTRDRLEAVYRFLQDIGAYARMLETAEALAAANELVRAAEGAQVWSKITACLDQIAALYENCAKAPSAKTIGELIEQALAVAELKPLPQSADAVSAGSLEHMKTRPVRLLIIAGATDVEEISPAAILSDTEREQLENDVWLGPNRAERSRMRMLAAKTTISFAQDMVWISWHTSGADGSVRRPGSLVRSVRGIFPKLTVSGGVTESEREQALRLLDPNAALSHAGEALRREGGPSELETEALQALASMDAYRSKLENLRPALLGDPLHDSIPAETAQKLYEGPTELSVTRLELFARCPFSHFLRYGARPEEIREYGVTPIESGNFFHEALETYTKNFHDETDIETAVARMDEITAEILERSLSRIAQDGAVNARETQELRAVARRAAVTSLRHMGASKFSPAAAETAFGKASAIRLQGASLIGFIDRVDLWKNENETYLRIVDYKRGGRELSFSQMYYGLQLQLLVYLVAAGAMYDAQYAAALYFNVSDPLIPTDSLDPEQVENARTKKLRLDGVVLNDPEVIKALANPPEIALPVALSADGTPRKSDKLLDREDFALLAQNALACAQQDLDEIRSGVIGARPVSIDAYSPCAYCDFAAVCRRDVYTASSRERKLPPLKAAEALEALRKREEPAN